MRLKRVRFIRCFWLVQYSIFLYNFLCIAVQIFYNGHFHWVATTTNGNVYLYDSVVGDHHSCEVELQIAMVYQKAAQDDGPVVTSV